jgi:membrane-bound metal-dependent hydrolase YbcI (DUF457 family)
MPEAISRRAIHGMFIGHYALAFAAKRWGPRGSLPAYFLATQLPDVTWPLFVLTGQEHVSIAPGDTAWSPLCFDSYPWSHSFVMSIAWGLVWAGLAWVWTRDRAAAWLSGALVVGHWLLDFISHRADLPLAPGLATKVGLGLWNSVPGTMAFELGLLAAGVSIYRRATEPKDAQGKYGLWVLVGMLLFAYLGAAFGPPPPNARAVAVADIVGTLVALAASAWVDRYRPTRTAPP